MKPFISIVVPCYNEERTISSLLEAVRRQTYPRDRMEVIIADGMSTDATRNRITGFIEKHPDLRIQIVDNPKRIIPAGVNAAVNAASGEIIIRLDGHSKPNPEYVDRCVIDLESKLGDNVGGVWEIKPSRNNWLARSIALAAAHPLGVGDAQYRLGGRSGPVDTVPFGAFKRKLFIKLGGFDENLLTNEDYEFNTRIQKSGGVVWLDSAIRTEYLARSNLIELGQQYFRYGYWKLKMLRKYPRSLRLRQFLPPLFVASLVSLSLASFFLQTASYLLIIELIIYLTVLLGFGSIVALKQKEIGCIIGFPASVATMHICWGAGFLWSLIR